MRHPSLAFRPNKILTFFSCNLKTRVHNSFRIGGERERLNVILQGSIRRRSSYVHRKFPITKFQEGGVKERIDDFGKDFFGWEEF